MPLPKASITLILNKYKIDNFIREQFTTINLTNFIASNFTEINPNLFISKTDY